MDIKNFLKSSYKKENFIEFISNKFNKFEENNTDYETPDTVSEQKNIEKYKFLGEVKLNDGKEIGFFEFKSTKNIDIENNRVSLNAILKKRVEHKLLDGAIAVFANPYKLHVWRLSFIQFSYDEEDKQQVSNLKRYTYVLGEKIPTKTAYSQLNSLESSTIEELQEAFGVEKVSKEFFEEYKELYYETCKYLQSQIVYFKNEKNLKLFTKKLLGRIVFLYFLEKKGWLGSDENWQNGDKKFLTNLFMKNKNSNFYEDILRPIFFEALNTKRENDYFNKLDCKMPFLNGGLFSEDEFDKQNIFIENSIFKKIFETFDSYNFTIIEDSPDDSEVAIDPEILGIVFEDLLEDRKNKGTFYTPRPIVHYMCQQSIINYLSNQFDDIDSIKSLILKQNTDNNKLVKKSAKKIYDSIIKIKILDPAIGSGAYPMGMLHEIVKVLSNLDKTINIGKLKREVIENSIYGIDIEQSAVEIAKLRFWLSIVVDEEKPAPLPNLFYKIMVGNSLLETINGFDPFQENKESMLSDNTKIKKIQKLIHVYFKEDNNTKKQTTQDEINSTIENILQVKAKEYNEQIKLKSDKLKVGQQKEKDRLSKSILEDMDNLGLFNKIIKEKPTTELFFYKLYFAEVINSGGFDVVIGNPPYVRQEKIKELKLKKEIQNFNSYNGTADLYIYFFEKGYKLLKENGILSFITSNKYTRAKYGVDFRKFVLEKTDILQYIDFNGVKVFKSATVDTSIMTYRKSKKRDNSFTYCDVNEEYKKNTELNKFIDNNSSDYSQNNLTKDSFSFATPEELKIKKQIEKIGTPLKEWDIKINYGIKTGFNEAFIIDGKTKDQLIAKDSKSAEIIKPLLRGRDIKKYGYEFADKWLIATFPSLKLNIDSYPHVKIYLEKFLPKLEQSGENYLDNFNIEKKCRKKTNNKWFETQDTIAYLKEFNKEKIVYSEIVQKPQFYLDSSSFYCEASSFLITGNNLKYLMALLNSKQTCNFFKKFYMGTGLGLKGFRYKKDFLNLLPIPRISKQQQKPFEILVDCILFAKEKDMKNEALLFESTIDGMVYDLYFPNEMSYIIDEVTNIVKPWTKSTIDKKESIELVYASFKDNKTIQKGLKDSEKILTLYS